MYKFYGWKTADVKDERGLTPRDYYDLLSECWSAETCAPRMRPDWSPANRTLGQCSITAFLLGTSMLFHYGRTFEINDLAVDPAYQRRGIAKKLLERCLADVKAQGMSGVHLITAGEGILPSFYQEYGFKKETVVILMGLEL